MMRQGKKCRWSHCWLNFMMTRSRSRKRKNAAADILLLQECISVFPKNWRVKMTQTPCGKESKCWKRPQARIWRGSGRRLSGRDWRMRAILAEIRDGEREQDWCQESFLYYERLLCSRQDGNRRKNLLRAAELALQFDMQEKAEQYLNEAAEIPGMEEDIFYQQIRKRWEEAG